jgi:hypothetical protein
MRAATLGRSLEPAGTGADWGWASPDAGVGPDADATNATSPRSRNSRIGALQGWWADEPKGQGLEVLHDGGEVELVAST